MWAIINKTPCSCNNYPWKTLGSFIVNQQKHLKECMVNGSPSVLQLWPMAFNFCPLYKFGTFCACLGGINVTVWILGGTCIIQAGWDSKLLKYNVFQAGGWPCTPLVSILTTVQKRYEILTLSHSPAGVRICNDNAFHNHVYCNSNYSCF